MTSDGDSYIKSSFIKTAMVPQQFTILYIEDDSAIRQLVTFLLQRRDNFQLLEAETGTKGVQMAIECQPDMILLDLSLPDISGFDVLKQLQNHETTSTIPIIAVSGNSSPNDIELGLNAGFDHYLTKPLTVAGFDTVINETIAAKY